MAEKSIWNTGLSELKDYLQISGDKPFRSKQIFEWLWKKNILSWEEMKNIPIPLRNKLIAYYEILPFQEYFRMNSNDGTVKLSFQCKDTKIFESVLIPTDNRVTACISVQSGCKLGCRFCATAAFGFQRDLEESEITAQIMYLRNLSEKIYGISISNIVVMGMGEPFLNYDAVISSLKKLVSPDLCNFSSSRITISTVGIPEMIKQFADENTGINLALSLHAADDVKRSKLIPMNNKHSLQDLKEALVYYHEKTKQRITIEYILFHNVNDSPEDAMKLAAFCRYFPVKINIIEYNTGGNIDFRPTTPVRRENFIQLLQHRNMVVNLRKSRGKDIDAACGQLAGRKIKKG